MENKKTQGSAGDKPARKRTRKRMSTKELREKHMGDQHNRITDEDIRNIKIDTHVEKNEPLDLPEGNERPKDADKDHKMTTPWDVIDES